MKKNLIFTGVATALVTPFSDGEIDFSALGNIIDFQIGSGVDALVIAGTTGEASTLSEDERIKLFEFAKERVGGKLPLIFGTGTNDTKTAIKYTHLAERLGADGALVVTPYYNKGTESGIINHYKSIANNTDLPIILYNVPARTGVTLSISVIEALCDVDNIVAIKEASDSTDRLTALSVFSDRLTLYSGNDSQVYPTLALGGKGVISVLSNADPCEVLKITRAYFTGRSDESLAAQKAILPKIQSIFAETNPSPIKYVMKKRGFCRDEMRLPLTPPTKETRDRIDRLF